MLPPRAVNFLIMALGMLCVVVGRWGKRPAGYYKMTPSQIYQLAKAGRLPKYTLVEKVLTWSGVGLIAWGIWRDLSGQM